MMWRQCAFGVVLGVFVGLGLCAQVDVSLSQENSGFFLKPMFRGQDVFSLNSQERPFIISQPTGPVTVKAKYGPFSAERDIPLSLLQTHLGNHSNILANFITQDIDVSAHLVSRTITEERPVVSVLFHASQLPHSELNKIKTTKSPSDLRWCIQMHIEKDGEELATVCVISIADNVCVADLTLPATWWLPEKTTSAEVYYSIYPVDKLGLCSTTPHPDPSVPPDEITAETKKSSDTDSYYPPPDKPEVPSPVKTHIDSVTLTHGQVTYQELKEDQHILVYIPQKSFYPGSSFKVPIRLQAGSDLQIFVIKVKARHGIRIVDAVATDPTRWRASLDVNHKNKAAMVTASIANQQTYSKSDRVQNVFDFLFEVEDGATGDDRGRLSFTLAYEMNSQQRELYGGVENRVVARLDIQQDNTHAIVPVIKTTEMINMAMLTGKTVSAPMRIYSISQGGKVADITSTTTCHSGDDNILKVAQSCNLVYLDGTETHGSGSVSIIAKYGRHNEFLFFKVWVPELPLDIQLSDDKLSQIKGWKVPFEHSGISRQTRGVDFGLLTHPDLLFHEEGSRKDDMDTSCQLRYQQTEVEVYARFTLDEHDKQQYYVHRKAMFRVTEEMLDRLRIADVSVAKLRGNVVKGMKPGRTEIQVMNRLGRAIGAHEIRVGQGKVVIEKLEVDIVTGLSVTLDSEPQIEGVLKANVHRQTQLTRNYQEGILDIKMWFDDGTSTALHHVLPSDYMLESDTLNNHVVAFGPQLSADMPRVIALGPGKGELLKISLELGEACQKKKSRNLAVSYVYVNINFDESTFQSDAGHYMYNNRANDRYGKPGVNADGGKIFISMDDHEELMKKKQGYEDQKGKKSDGVEAIPIDDLDFAKPVGSNGAYGPNSEAQQQLVMEAQRMTPLEIGMYVLLAIFCVAIVVFMVNCMVFVARYKKKQKPQETKDPVANVNDWVWIGRATLERNAINTTCSQALMSESDFNGNHNNVQYLVPPDSANSKESSSSGDNSNRNSVISTYKGSECSIRITANPLPDDPLHTDDDVIEEDSTSCAPSTPGHAPVPITRGPLPSNSGAIVKERHSTSEPPVTGPPPENVVPARASCPGVIGTLNLSSDSDCSLGRDYFKDDSEPGPSRAKSGKAEASGEDKDKIQKQRREALQVALAESIKAQQDSANGNIANGNISEAEWDYEVMGLTYDQLMDYFDNLKESTA